jgi:biopolymer transport protein TolQ
MAKMVLVILLFASVTCWAIIFTKWRSIKLAMAENKDFLEAFWHGKNIDEIFAKSEKYTRSPVALVFQSGVKELKKIPGSDTQLEDQAVHNISRALNRASSNEIAVLEKHVNWLATTASASPFVGLFGTVWGIMNSFQGIGASGSANLAVVAPGISEALITTATGIAAAVPAVIAYNFFVGMIRKQAVDMDSFSQDFLNIIQRSTLSGARKKAE